MIDFWRQIGGGEGAVAGDQETAASADDDFSGLVRRQSRLVFRVANSVLRNSHDAEDTAQETFLKLYRTGNWKNIRDERAFLARTAWRLAIDRRARASESGGGGPAACGKTPEQMAVMSDWLAVVHSFIDALPSKLREPLVLTALEELSSQQIAEVLGLPDSTVRTRLLRARQILKAKLAAHLGDSHGTV